VLRGAVAYSQALDRKRLMSQRGFFAHQFTHHLGGLYARAMPSPPRKCSSTGAPGRANLRPNLGEKPLIRLDVRPTLCLKLHRRRFFAVARTTGNELDQGEIVMCDVCVINAVKDKMLSRRSFFVAGAAVAAVAAVGAGTTTPAMARFSGRYDPCL